MTDKRERINILMNSLISSINFMANENDSDNRRSEAKDAKKVIEEILNLIDEENYDRYIKE